MPHWSATALPEKPARRFRYLHFERSQLLGYGEESVAMTRQPHPHMEVSTAHLTRNVKLRPQSVNAVAAR
jgi:hypothetical protein